MIWVGLHEEAQARYRRGLELSPHDPALSLNLALSLALVGNYPEAIGVLRPIAMGSNASAWEHQTLALIYGLAGYDILRRLSPEARQQAIQSHGAHRSSGQSS